MNFNKFINSDYLKSNPLCGISTYKDELNLATGACTRQIKKLKLLSSLGWKRVSNGSFYTSDITDYLFEQKNIVKCSHFTSQLNVTGTSSVIDNNVAFYYNLSQQQVREFYVAYRSITSLDEFKAFLDNNDVYIWYVLATPTTETITVPSGLSGTEEGYLIQDGTPTPTNPIYPTANEVKVWHDIPHYIHNTSTDTITTLPADVYANDTTATVGLKGNMSQTGTPSPTNPIQPQETGERTGNLFDKNATNVNNGYISNGYLRSDGSINTNTDYRASEYIRISQNQQYILYYGASLNNSSVCFYDSAKNYISGIAYANRWDVPFTTPQNAEYLRLSLRAVDLSSVILNLGSIRLPYEPYGIKIPILSNSTTTPVYLGEVESTRKIKKWVLTGQEDWTRTANEKCYYINLAKGCPADYLKSNIITVICSHYEGQKNTNSGSNVVNEGCICFFTGGGYELYIGERTITTAADFKTYLQQQYAAGTPVTVWYVLATPTTGIVNEPLRKIGDYADEVSGITIPTIAGANAIDVDTTLKPSEVTVNYKGWHPVSGVHERENGQWD